MRIFNQNVYSRIVRAPNIPVPHGFTTRNGGVSWGNTFTGSFNLLGADPAAPLNRQLLMREFPLKELRLLRQVHGAVCVKSQSTALTGGPVEADAHYTTDKSVLLGVGVADCAPVLLYSSVAPAVIAIHAGWKGTLQHIVLESVLDVSLKLGVPHNSWVAAIGPRLRPCCMEVQRDVYSQWPKWALQFRASKIFLDFGMMIVRDLHKLGIRNIWEHPHCTCCRKDLYFSFRRDGKLAQGSGTGRMLGVIGLGY